MAAQRRLDLRSHLPLLGGPLLFRFRTIDRLPQTPSSASTRGTVVHAVLERLYDLPAVERTLEAAAGLLQPEWERLLEAEPDVAGLFPDEAELTTWLRFEVNPPT